MGKTATATLRAVIEAADHGDREAEQWLTDHRFLLAELLADMLDGTPQEINDRVREPVLSRLREHLPASSPAPLQFAWLIERVHEGSPVWQKTDATWTSDANEARRFASAEEARRVIAATRADAVAVEHGFADSIPAKERDDAH